MNIPNNIKEKMNKNLHNQENHPICLIKELIYQLLPDFDRFDNLNPLVSIEDNFDSLLIPSNHPSRSLSDTYYWDSSRVLRTHTSAHQVSLLNASATQFLITGDVYRKDDADRTHYPIFHQMEGVRICDDPEKDLHSTLEMIISRLFQGAEWKLTDSYFPFTNPSWEVEVLWEGQWLEILGCGVIESGVLANAGISGTGWAFGMGLERLAMILYKIPDIRLFWSEDPRFLNQFKAGTFNQFSSYSKHPACYKDIAFWMDDEKAFSRTEMVGMLREIAGDLIEEVRLIDRFVKMENGKEHISHCYRINYRSWDRTLTNEEINLLHDRFRAELSKWNLELR